LKNYSIKMVKYFVAECAIGWKWYSVDHIMCAAPFVFANADDDYE